jgi:hypothetical protein
MWKKPEKAAFLSAFSGLIQLLPSTLTTISLYSDQRATDFDEFP